MAADGPLPLMQPQKRPHRHGAAVLPEAPPCGRRTSREPIRTPQGGCCIHKAAPPCGCFRRAVGSLKGGAALWAAEPKTEGHPKGCPSVLEGAVKILILKSRKGIEGPLNRPSGRRRFCAVRAFCRRQNLGAGGIHFRRAFQIPPDTIKITTPGRCGYFYGASGGTRTHTVSLPTDFESVTSTNSITLALDTGLLYKKAPGNSRPFSRRSASPPR